MWTRQRKKPRLHKPVPLPSACPSTHLLSRAQLGQGPPGYRICAAVPRSHRWGGGGEGVWTTSAPAAPMPLRPVPTSSPHRRVTVAQRWTERPGSLARPDRGPTARLLLTRCLSGTRWKLVAWPGQFFFGESSPSLQAPSSGIALGSDRQVADGQTASCGWGLGSVCPVSPSWWVRPRVCALSCHATSHVLTLGPPLPPLPGNLLSLKP